MSEDTGPKELHLVRTAVDMTGLHAFAAQAGLLDDDLGYALHSALRQRYGAAAPQPFRLMPPPQSAPAGTPHRLLGYLADVEPLMQADPPRAGAADKQMDLPNWWTGDWDMDDVLARVFPKPVETRQMPDSWQTDTTLGFEARLRPVVRYGPKARAARKAEGKPDPWERDAFLAALEHRDAEGGSEKTGRQERGPIYREWLERQFESACALEAMRLVSHRRIRTIRARSRNEAGKRPLSRFEGPEIIVDGRLRVTDPDAFAERLARGVGRHRAFGFGMLLLKPPGR